MVKQIAVLERIPQKTITSSAMADPMGYPQASRFTIIFQIFPRVTNGECWRELRCF